METESSQAYDAVVNCLSRKTHCFPLGFVFRLVDDHRRYYSDSFVFAQPLPDEMPRACSNYRFGCFAFEGSSQQEISFIPFIFSLQIAVVIGSDR